MIYNSENNFTLSSLRLVAWEATRSCNLHCLHCRADAENYVYDNELKTNEVKNLFESIRRINKSIIIISGGEPLLRTDLDQIINFARELGHSVVLAVGDGSLLADEKIKNLKACGVERISLSLHYPEENQFDTFCGKEGSFRSILNAINLLKNYNFDFQINTTVMKSNYKYIGKLYEFILKIRPIAWHLFFVVPTGRAKYCNILDLSADEVEQALNEIAEIHIKEELLSMQNGNALNIKVTCAPQYVRIRAEKLSNIAPNYRIFQNINQTKNKACMAGNSFVFISSTGDVKPCGYFNMVAGNIRDQPFDEIYMKSKLFNDLRSSNNLKGGCGICGYKNLCGGCRARALAKYADYLRSDPDCLLSKQLELELLKKEL